MNGEGADRQHEEELFQRLLVPATVQEPSVEQIRRWTDLFSRELRAARRRRYVYRFSAAAACIVAVVLVVTLAPWLDTETPPAGGAVVARVVTAFGGNVVRKDGEVVRVLETGAGIRARERVESGLRSGLGLIYGNVDVRLDAQTSVIVHEGRLALQQGTLYIDVPPLDGSTVAHELWIDTPIGAFGHLGTQFLVSVLETGVSGAVREGAIVLRRGGRTVRLAATGERARRVVVDPSGDLRESEVPTSGPLWAWALRSSPGIVVADRSPEEVLVWVARERGQRLVYADETAERLARETRLRGSAVELSVEDAVATIDGTTRLRIEASGTGGLVVALDSEGDQNAH